MAWGSDPAKLNSGVNQFLGALGALRSQPPVHTAAAEETVHAAATADEAAHTAATGADLGHGVGANGRAATSFDSTLLAEADVQVRGPQAIQVVDVPVVTRFVQVDTQGNPIAAQAVAGGPPQQTLAYAGEGAAPRVGHGTGLADGPAPKLGDRLVAALFGARTSHEVGPVATEAAEAVQDAGQAGARVGLGDRLFARLGVVPPSFEAPRVTETLSHLGQAGADDATISLVRSQGDEAAAGLKKALEGLKALSKVSPRG